MEVSEVYSKGQEGCIPTKQERELDCERMVVEYTHVFSMGEVARRCFSVVAPTGTVARKSMRAS